MSEATLARQPAPLALTGATLARWIALLLPLALYPEGGDPRAAALVAGRAR